MQEGTKAMETYYNPEDLDKFSTMGEEAPELWDLYMAYYGKVFAEGALTAREKGVTEEQMTEAFHVANAIRGGAALVHGVQMKNVVKQLEM